MTVIAQIVFFTSFAALVVGVVGLFRPIIWARITTRKTAGIVMAASFVVFMISGAFVPQDEHEAAQPTTTTALEAPSTETSQGASDDAEPEDGPRTTTSAGPTTTTTTIAVVTTPTTPPLPEYAIVAEEDISFAGAVRYSLRVTVEAGVNRDGLRRVAEAIQS